MLKYVVYIGESVANAQSTHISVFGANKTTFLQFSKADIGYAEFK